MNSQQDRDIEVKREEQQQKQNKNIIKQPNQTTKENIMNNNFDDLPQKHSPTEQGITDQSNQIIKKNIMNDNFGGQFSKHSVTEMPIINQPNSIAKENTINNPYDNFEGQFQDFFPTKSLTKQTLIYDQQKFICKAMILLYYLTVKQQPYQKELFQIKKLLKKEKFRNLRYTLTSNKIKYNFIGKWQPQKSYFFNSTSVEQIITNTQSEQLNVANKFLQNLLLLQKCQILIEKLGRLQNHEYRMRYLKDISQIVENKQNYHFYTHKKSIKNNKISISDIHAKKQKQQYQWLQSVHDYIQWLFPNHYTSSFNHQSFPLSYLQANLFRTDKDVGKNMILSIQTYFDFLGIKFNRQNLHLKLISLQRLKQALLVNTHNHLRIRRVLACLSVTGFRMVALNLISFLEQAVKSKTFKRLAQQFYYEWKIYDDKQGSKEAQSLCFIVQQQFSKEIHNALLDNLKLPVIRQDNGFGDFQNQQSNKGNQKQQQGD